MAQRALGKGEGKRREAMEVTRRQRKGGDRPPGGPDGGDDGHVAEALACPSPYTVSSTLKPTPQVGYG